jgi:hypothetical protein
MKGMKIDHEEIKKLYKAYLAEKTPQKKKDCPSPESIFSLFQPSTSDSKRNEILTHVLKCNHCTKDLQFILSTHREEKKFTHDIEEVLESAKESNKKDNGSKSFFFSLSWKYAYFLIGAMIIAVLIVLNIPTEHVYRGTNHQSIRLISPLNKHHSKSDLLFKWEMVKNADYFILEIFNDSLYPIWKSEKTTINRINLPSDALEKLSPNKEYYWVVTAYIANDRIVESQLQKFGLVR